LLPLLQGLGWRGDLRHVAEAIPHFIDSIDITSYRNVLANLNFESRPVAVAVRDVDPRLMPCLFLAKDREAVVLLGLEDDHVRAFDGGSGQIVRLPKTREKGTAYFFSRVEQEDLLPAAQKTGWFRAVAERFRGLVYQILGITLILNVLALATPLFVMAVYDKVVATGSLPTLGYFGIGVGIAILCDGVLRAIRTRILAFIGARLDNIVGNAVFRRILFLPPAFTERATVGAQVARIKDFETVRDFFTGPMALTFFELPFTLLFVVVIGFLGGPVAFVPLIMMALFAVLGVVMQPLIRASVAKAARGSSRRQEILVESLGTMRAVKYGGAEATWSERFREASAKASLNSFYTAQYSSLVQTVSTMLMTASGLATIVFGVFRVLSGDMTVGALVASMILVWRVLAPLQIVFISLTRLTQVRSSINQINALMNLKPEREPGRLVNPIRRLSGRVTFSRVSIRYSPDADPALVGVSFDVEPGEAVVIVGGNGSGKSTVLKLLAGMYPPQAGSIRVDNQDIRQLDPVELRHAIAYVPQTFEFFYGTIAQNLRLAHPVATQHDLEWAAREAGVLQDIQALEQGSGKWKRKGFEVRIGDAGAAQMPTSLLQRLNLARGYLKRAPIMLFDEPGNGLDFAGDQAFMERVLRMKGQTTVFIVTHRPSHLKLADKIIWLEAGAVRAVGPAAEVRKQMPKEFL
jgi:ATP-binding cassette subfamily C protein/ATP-binding cassette subfamily C protein LapB